MGTILMDLAPTKPEHDSTDDATLFDIEREYDDTSGRLARSLASCRAIQQAVKGYATETERTLYIRRGLTQWLPAAQSDEEAATLAFYVNAAMADASANPIYTLNDRLRGIAVALNVSTGTARSRIATGKTLVDLMTRRARGKPDSQPKRALRQRPSAVTKLDNETACIVTALLEHHAVREAIEAADRKDAKAGRTLTVERVATLIALGICTEPLCRWLAARSPSEQTAWLAQHVRDAVAGTAEQRAAARARLNDAQFMATAAAFVRDQDKLRQERERAAKRRSGIDRSLAHA